MIYWNGGRRFGILSAAGLFEGAYFDYRRTKFTLPSVMGSGRSFILKMAVVMRSSIVIYDRLPVCFNKWRTRIIERIPFVSEYAESFPEKFAIRTKNIDLLRELIAQGKKVTWFEPDLYTQANYLGILNFEHVFLESNLDTHIIYPSGEAVERDQALSWHPLRGWMIKYSKRVGMNFKDIHDRINWEGLRRYQFRKGLPVKQKEEISREIAANVYNIFSLTYLIWQRSKLNATTAKKKIVPKGY